MCSQEKWRIQGILFLCVSINQIFHFYSLCFSLLEHCNMKAKKDKDNLWRFTLLRHAIKKICLLYALRLRNLYYILEWTQSTKQLLSKIQWHAYRTIKLKLFVVMYCFDLYWAYYLRLLTLNQTTKLLTFTTHGKK